MAKNKPAPAKKPTGRPAHEPNNQRRETVRMLIIGGYRQDSVAEVLGIDPKTLRAHYRNELNLAKSTVDAMVTMTIVKKMLGETTVTDEKGNVSKVYDHKEAESDLLKFYSARRMGWKEPKQEINHSGSVGQYDLTKLTDEELDRVESILGRAAISSGDGDTGREGEEES